MPQTHPTQDMVQAFVAPEDEVVDNEEEFEERILATYQPIPDDDSDDDGIPEHLFISHHQALAALETITLYRRQSGPLSETTEQLFYHERQQIESAQLSDKRKGKQTAITDFFTSSGAFCI